MLNKTTEAQTHHAREANANRKAAAGPAAAALAPPGYAIGFLDRRSEPESLLDAGSTNRHGSSMTGTERQGSRPWPASAHATGRILPIGSARERHRARESWQMVQGRPQSPTTGEGRNHETASARQETTPARGLETVSAPGRERAIPDKPLIQTRSVLPSPDKPTTADRRGAVNFLATVSKPEPESVLAVKSPVQPEKPRFPLDARPIAGKDAAAPEKTADVVGVKASPHPIPALPIAKAEAVRPARASAQATPVAAPNAPPPSLASQPPEAEAALGQRQGVEALAEDKAESPAQEKTQEKIDAASPEMATPIESYGPTEPASSAAPTEFASEPQAPPEALAENSTPIPDGGGSGGSLLAAPPPPSGNDGLAAAQAAESQQTAAVERAEQADQARATEQAMQQRAEEQAQERAEAQPETQAELPAGSAQEGGAESVELSPSEKAAGLATVGEDVGGGKTAFAGSEGGGGGGGGNEALPSEAQAPDTASMSPEAGLVAAATLPAGEAPKALAGVGSAVDSSVQQESERLQGEIPEVEVGGEADGTAVKPLAVPSEAVKTQRAQTANTQSVPAPKPLPEPPPSAVRNIPTPRVAGNAEGTLSAADARRVQSSIQALPTTDPGLDVSAGPPPALQLSGDADPAQIAGQKEKLNASILAQCAQGAAEVAAPAGENDIRVRRRKESLKAPLLAVPPGAATAGAESADEAIAIIAEEKKGGEVRAAISQAQGEIAVKKAEHQSKVIEEQNKARQQLTDLQTENASQQDVARTQAKSEVDKARADWSEEQRKEVTKADEKTQAELANGDEKIAREQKQADEQSSQHIAEGERQAQRHKRDAEAEAERKKKDAEGESQGVFGWAASKVSAFFDTLKQGLVTLFDAAKKLVRAAIEQAKKLAVAVIEKARAVVVLIIRAIGDALIAIGDALLVAFPALRAKWRAFIESKVKAAEDLVNRLADALKRNVQKLLDALGKGLEFMLDVYKKGMMMALDAAKAVALGAIKFAKSVADTLGAFVVLIKDIAQNPGQWLANLGAAVKDGIKNHLWKAFSSAVKSWFNDKIEEVLGLGTAIWNILKKGGIALKEIGAMVWEGLKAAIPVALIGLLIEKLVAMIVPAAGAVLIVIEGLKAAWGSIQRILAAIGKFVEFLKAVKTGGAGPQFAVMLAAAAIVVIDFVANWLLRKLRGPASKVSGKIKGIAQRIMARIKAIAKKAGRWVKGKFKGLKDKFKGWRKKSSDWREKRKTKSEGKDKEKEDSQRLYRTVSAIRPKLRSLLARGVSKLRLRATLAGWRLWYRIKRLSLDGNRVVAANSPAVDIETLVTANLTQLQRMIHEAGEEVMNDPKVQQAQSDYAASEQKAAAANAASLSDSPISTVTAVPGAGYLGAALALRDPSRKAGFREPHTFLSMPFAPWVVNQQQSVKGPGGLRIGGGRIPGSGQRKINYDALVGELNAFGVDDKAFAKHLSTFVATGQATGPFQKPEGQAYLADFARIAFTAETARSTSFAMEGPMLLSLMESGQISAKDTFARNSPLNPMSMVGAAAANRVYTARILGQSDPPKTTKTARDNYQKVVQRRKELLIRYITVEVRAKNLVFSNEGDFMRWAQEKLRPLIVQRARQFYGMAESPSLADLNAAIPAHLRGRWDQKTVGQA